MTYFRLAAWLLLSCLTALPPAAAAPASGLKLAPSARVEVLFTPGDAAARRIIALIDGARREILVQVYSFTSHDVANALIRAHRRGVDVQVLADAGLAREIRKNRVRELARAGVPVFLDAVHQSAHNKVVIIDRALATPVVITGSYNFSYAAERKNAENVLIFTGDRALAKAYADNWQRHRRHATALPKSR